MAHTFKPSAWDAEAGDLCKFEASLVYIQVPGQPEVESEILSQKNRQRQKGGADKQREMAGGKAEREEKKEKKSCFSK